MALNLVAGVLTGNTQGGDPGGEERPWGRGQRLRPCGQGRGHSSHRKPEEAKGDSPRDLWGGHGAAATLSSDSGPPELTEDVFLWFKSPGFADLLWQLLGTSLFIHLSTYSPNIYLNINTYPCTVVSFFVDSFSFL